MKTFIRATEVWVPGVDGTVLELGAGAYGEAVRFGALSQGVRFAYGEGLPGKCWQEGRPIILKQFENSYFQRTEAAHADGLTCGIAMPIFAGDFLTAVLVIFCGDDAEHAGAIELWHNAPPSVDMTLADGHYGRTGDTFETVARQVSLRRGSGLPGLAWQRGGPIFMADLGRGSGFLRADSAQRVGINRGFAFPCSGRGEDTWIMAFLSALGTPLVRRFEVWEPDADAPDARLPRLLRTGGFCEQAGMLADPVPGHAVDAGQGSIGRVALTGMPALSGQVSDEPVVGTEAAAAGLTLMVAVPVIRAGRLGSVVVWYF